MWVQILDSVTPPPQLRTTERDEVKRVTYSIFMVRKKRKSTADDVSDVLSVRKRLDGVQLKVPAFPITDLVGYAEVGKHLLSQCTTVHTQLQALQTHRRLLRDETQSPGSSRHYTDNQCAFLLQFAMDIIATPQSNPFHKICGLLIDDLHSYSGTKSVTQTAVGNMLTIVAQRWRESDHVCYDATTATECLRIFVGTDVIVSFLNNRNNISFITDSVVPSFIDRVTTELLRAGCSYVQDVPMDHTIFANQEESVSKLLHAVLLCCIVFKKH